MQILLLSIGIVIGILISVIAVIVGKRLEVRINVPVPPTQPKVKKAVIIKKEPDEFMDEINDNNKTFR